MKIYYLLLLFLLNCNSERASVRLNLNDKEIFSCKESVVTKLSPGNGGFLFTCKENSSSIYVIYDTSKETANDGTIKEIYLKYKGEDKTFKTAVYSSKRGEIDCQSAKSLNRVTGEQPFAESLLGFPKKASYSLEMAEPCGKLIFHIE